MPTSRDRPHVADHRHSSQWAERSCLRLSDAEPGEPVCWRRDDRAFLCRENPCGNLSRGAKNFISLADATNSDGRERTATPRPILLSVTLVLVTVVAGLATRFARSLAALRRQVWRFRVIGTDDYWIVSTILPRCRPVSVVALASRRPSPRQSSSANSSHFPALVTFRLTLAGVLLLGSLLPVWGTVDSPLVSPSFSEH